MKRIGKSLASCLLAFTLMVISHVPAHAATDTTAASYSPSVYLNATSKLAFADEMDAVFVSAKQSGEIESAPASEIEALLLRIPLATEEEKEAINAELETYGVYEYDTPIIISKASTPGLDAGNVKMSVPTIYYQAWNNSWSVTCGGNWTNDEWRTQISSGSVGGLDGFGVYFSNSSLTYKSSVLSASAFITDEDEEYSRSTSNRSDGPSDGAYGFGFQLQDYILNNPTTPQYIGYKWSGICTYDNWFGNYNGVATGYYLHTYNKTELSSVSLGKSGFSASFSGGSDFFKAFSNDKTFGVYP